MLDSLLAVGRVGVDERPAETYGAGTEGEGFDDVCCSSDTPVDVDFEFGVREELAGAEFTDDFDEDFEPGSGAVELTTTAKVRTDKKRRR